MPQPSTAEMVQQTGAISEIRTSVKTPPEKSIQCVPDRTTLDRECSTSSTSSGPQASVRVPSCMLTPSTSSNSSSVFGDVNCQASDSFPTVVTGGVTAESKSGDISDDQKPFIRIDLTHLNCRWGDCLELRETENDLYDHVVEAHIETIKEKRRKKSSNEDDGPRCHWHHCTMNLSKGTHEKKLEWLLNHFRTRHAAKARTYKCIVGGCDMRFYTGRLLAEHVRIVHMSGSKDKTKCRKEKAAANIPVFSFREDITIDDFLPEDDIHKYWEAVNFNRACSGREDKLTFTIVDLSEKVTGSKKRKAPPRIRVAVLDDVEVSERKIQARKDKILETQKEFARLNAEIAAQEKNDHDETILFASPMLQSKRTPEAIGHPSTQKQDSSRKKDVSIAESSRDYKIRVVPSHTYKKPDTVTSSSVLELRQVSTRPIPAVVGECKTTRIEVMLTQGQVSSSSAPITLEQCQNTFPTSVVLANSKKTTSSATVAPKPCQVVKSSPQAAPPAQEKTETPKSRKRAASSDDDEMPLLIPEKVVRTEAAEDDFAPPVLEMEAEPKMTPIIARPVPMTPIMAPNVPITYNFTPSPIFHPMPMPMSYFSPINMSPLLMQQLIASGMFPAPPVPPNVNYNPGL